MTDVDTYWRTRCVGEAIDQGYAFLRPTCGVPEVWTCGARRVNDDMTARPTKTAAELADMIMRELRNYPECRNIEKVVITPTKREVAHHRNWNAAWVMGDEKIAAPVAWQIATKLQNEFDLTEDGAFSP